MFGHVVMVCKQNSKSKDTRIFAQSCKSRWSFFFDLELEQALFMLKKYNLEITQMSQIIYATSLQRKTLPFFHALRRLLPTS